MTIPQSQYLHSQNFNSKFVEFVWRFPELFQVIFIAFEDGMIYHEYGVVDESGEYVNGHTETSAAISNGHLTMDELQSLQKEAIEFLK